MKLTLKERIIFIWALITFTFAGIAGYYFSPLIYIVVVIMSLIGSHLDMKSNTWFGWGLEEKCQN